MVGVVEYPRRDARARLGLSGVGGVAVELWALVDEKTAKVEEFA